MRPYCEACDRPASVCLCSLLPSHPLPTIFTSLIILHHPHEARHPLATTPILAKSLQNCEIFVGRFFRAGVSAHLDRLASRNDPARCFLREEEAAPTILEHALLLFPGSQAVDLRTWLDQREYARSEEPCACAQDSNVLERDTCASIPASEVRRKITLLIVDGTWQHAKEMVKASWPFLERFTVQVCLPFDVGCEGFGMGDSSLTLRKEPFRGFMSTLEAVARALRILEPHGRNIEASLLAILQKMVSLQASHFTPLKRRPGRMACKPKWP